MEIVIYMLFLISGIISFFAYRSGIKDGISIKNGEKIPPFLKIAKSSIPDGCENDFYEQYSKLMAYDFDKAEDSNE